MTESPEVVSGEEPEESDTAVPTSARRPPNERRRPGEGLGSLVGGGGSQVGTNGAMRARDVSRPR
jgi:hypothetical protein